MYKAVLPIKNRLIYVYCDDYNNGRTGPFIRLLKAYGKMLGGKITEYSESCQYVIENDKLGLIFQWDGSFGINVDVPEDTDMLTAYDTLIRLFETM